MMKQTLLALCAIAAMTAMSADVVNAQDIHVGPGGVGIGPDHGYRDRGDNCHMVITHRRGPNGSITVRRRVCD
jgi:nitrous oxide reductase accessory protein NosL